LDARRFYRAAVRRYEEAGFLLASGGYTTAAVYLAGYAVECMLKAVILSNEPIQRNAETLNSFRGVHGHAFEWLREQMKKRQVHLPPDKAKELTRIYGWTTSLRYDPIVLRQRDAERFLTSVDIVIDWAKERC
jgi:HEPN domain-containing protein